ncbi:MAG: hypothetical protein AAF658_12925, partial [Myxococcota bacterium]
ALAGGDSGGPVFNQVGEVVALNSFYMPGRSVEAGYYHIHLDEIVAFLSELPASPRVELPELSTGSGRWLSRDAGGGALAALDSNGSPVVVAGRLDTSRSPEALLTDQTAPELVVLRKHGQFIAYYNTDRRGQADVALIGDVLTGPALLVVELGGENTEARSGDGDLLLDPKRAHPRAVKAVVAHFRDHFAPPTVRVSASVVGTVVPLEGAAYFRGENARHEPTFAILPLTDATPFGPYRGSLENLRPAVSVVWGAGRYTSRYDQDFDGRSDVVLRRDHSAGLGAEEAWTFEEGKLRRDPDLVGRLIVSGFALPRAPALSDAAIEVFNGFMRAPGNSFRAGFPDLFDNTGTETFVIPYSEAHVIVSYGEPAKAVVFDIDKDSAGGSSDPTDVLESFQSDSLDYEAAFLQSGLHRWVYLGRAANGLPKRVHHAYGDGPARAFTLSGETYAAAGAIPSLCDTQSLGRDRTPAARLFEEFLEKDACASR